MGQGRVLRPDYHLRQAEVCFDLAETVSDQRVARRYATMGSYFLRRVLRDDQEFAGRTNDRIEARAGSFGLKRSPVGAALLALPESRKMRLELLFDQILAALCPEGQAVDRRPRA